MPKGESEEKKELCTTQIEMCATKVSKEWNGETSETISNGQMLRQNTSIQVRQCLFVCFSVEIGA